MNVLVIPAWHDCANPLYAPFFHEFCQLLSKHCNVVMLDVNIHSYSERKKYKPKIDVINRNYKFLSFDYFNSIPGKLFGLNIIYQKKNIIKKALQYIQEYQNVNGEFNLVHILSVCNSISPIVAFEIAKKNKIPYLITEHYSGFEENINYIYKPFSNRKEITEIVHKSSICMGVSEYACGKYQKYFGRKFTVFPNSVNKIFEKEIISPDLIKNDEFTFLCIGRLEKNKGQLMLVQSFKNIAIKHSNLRLKLIGDGKDKALIKDFINRNNLLSISIEDWKNREELVSEIDKAHVIVSVSVKETFGLTVVEGFFRGKPAIVTNSGGPRDFMNSRNGILVDKYDADAIGKAIENMYVTYSLYDRDVIRQEAISKFSEDNLGIKMFAIYQTLIAKV